MGEVNDKKSSATGSPGSAGGHGRHPYPFHEMELKARQRWKEATLIFISHDVGETRTFERVVVIEEGQIVENAPPEVLSAQPVSRYRAQLDAEESVRTSLWTGATWRRLWLADGLLEERGRNEDHGVPPP